MDVVGKLDEYGRSAWLAVMILSFISFWPIGLAILAYMIWSGRMGCEKFSGPGRWWNMEKRRPRRHNGGSHGSSGNTAFDEYREETLARLKAEQEEFGSFLDRLRQAKDKAEFDQFMADRKDRPARNGNGNGGMPDSPENAAPA